MCDYKDYTANSHISDIQMRLSGILLSKANGNVET